MSTMTEKIADMIELLPEYEQNLAYEIVKSIVLAWDPDFTKVTPEESRRIERANEEMLRGECVSFESAEELAACFGVTL